MKLLLTLSIITTTFAIQAQISGTVKNVSGEPIENALICDANNVSNYTKTDGNGNYTLSSGNRNTALKVAALKYETVKSTLDRNIILSNDPLLLTDEYHISFDHLRVGNTYTENELKEDFPTSNGIGFYDGQMRDGRKDEVQDRASVDYTTSVDPGGVSLKVKYPKGTLKTGASGIDTRIPLMNTFKDNYYEASDLYLSYWLKFSDDFDFNLCGGKLPSLGGSDPNAPGKQRDQNRWKGRIMFRRGGGIQFYMELPGEQEPADNAANEDENELRFWGDRVVPGNDICTFEYENYLRKKGWHNIELHYVLESTPNGSDGLFEGWVDGVNYDFVGSDYFNYYRNPAVEDKKNGETIIIDRSKITLNHILISTFLGGSDIQDYAPKDNDYFVWFDEFRVSKTRINEWDKYMGNTESEEEDPSLSINDLDFNKSLKSLSVFPNPSTGVFHLTNSADWVVYNLAGKEIATGSDSNRINLNNQPKGVYFAKTANGFAKLILK